MAAFPPDTTELLLDPLHGFHAGFDTLNPATLGAAVFVMPDMETQELEAILEMHNPSLLLRELEAPQGQPVLQNPDARNGILLALAEHDKVISIAHESA
jgi:hypothetical protein